MTSTACASVSPARRLVVTATLLMLTLAGIAASASTALAAPATTASAPGQAESPAVAAAARPAVTATASSCDANTSLSNYANGQIPLSALCQLRDAPGQYLRADAAYNFNRLSAAYRKQFGTPICVSDSYRTLASQVELYKTKPKLAAIPGHSNHGLGIATDLCGGVQNFTSQQHLWMFKNAPLFRWIHPTWAQATGSRPEAWHWEYTPASPVVKQAIAAAKAFKAQQALLAQQNQNVQVPVTTQKPVTVTPVKTKQPAATPSTSSANG